MKVGIAIIFGACLLASASAQAQGTLQITFDGPPLIAPGAGVLATEYYESGMSFRPIPPSEHFARWGAATDPRDPDDGTAYLRAALGDSLMFSPTDGSTFSLVSVDLAEYSTVFSGQPVTVPFIGYHRDGSTVTTSFTTDGIIDGTGPLADFQTFDFNTQDWSDLTRVEIRTPLWSLDNLVVAVPEPTAAALLLFGALAIATLKLWQMMAPEGA